MRVKKFSIKEAVSFGWKVTKANLVFLIAIQIVVLLISVSLGVGEELFEEYYPLLSFILFFAGLILEYTMDMGIIRISLRLCDNQETELLDLFSCIPLFPKFLIGSILYWLIVIGGLILLIIPGIIWSIKFGFFGYFIVDRGLGPIEALRKSSKITEGAKWDLFILDLLLFGIFLLGVVALLIGAFVAMPITWIASAWVYRKLLAQAGITKSPLRS